LQLNRSLVTAIGIPVVAVVCAGAYLLASAPGSSPGHGVSGAVPGISSQPLPVAPITPTPSKSPVKKPKPKPKHKDLASVLAQGFVGVAVNGDISSTVSSFTHTTGIHPSVVELYTLFGAGFPRLQAHRVVESGSAPFIQWNPRHATTGQIASGQYDAYVRRFADAAKRFGHQIVLSFAHEMNGTWYPWGRPHATPAQFIGAWRRIHTIFAKQHVTNVIWSWDPSHTGSPASQWWPGKRYVDWIGIDGYQRPGQTFQGIFGQQLRNIRHVTSKPIFIAETAVAPGAGQARQVTGLFEGVSRYKLIGFVWFDINRLKAWRLEGRPAAIHAFRRSAARMGI
jgi:hypothetical protein